MIDASAFVYQDTVIVTGNIECYVDQLYYYIAASIKDIKDNLRTREKQKENLLFRKKMFSGPFRVNQAASGCPFIVTDENFSDAVKYLEDKIALDRKLLVAHRVNKGRLEGILVDGNPLDTLDLVNYAHDHLIVRVRYDRADHSVRMRVFFDKSAGKYMLHSPKSYDFAESAACFKGVEAQVLYGDEVKERPPGLDEFIASSSMRRSKIRVFPPGITVDFFSKDIAYAVELRDYEFKMLKEFQREWQGRTVYYGIMTEDLCDSRYWSEAQGRRILRFLYGIIGIHDSGHKGKPYHKFHSIPEVNEAAVTASLDAKTSFAKRMSVDSLPALAYVYQRTIELQERYGWDFVPRFTRRAVANNVNVTESDAEAMLNDATGILGVVVEQFNPLNHFEMVKKWFLPKTRVNAVYEISKRYPTLFHDVSI